MSRFTRLWNAHPGRANVCDPAVFKNQCSMRMAKALRSLGVELKGLRTCVDYDKKKFASHKPGHVRSAQQLANLFYRRPKAHGLGAKSFEHMRGSISKNIAKLKHRHGMIFIVNGWGRTDHIDIWKGNGATGVLKGGFNSYLKTGEQVWFWEFD